MKNIKTSTALIPTGTQAPCNDRPTPSRREWRLAATAALLLTITSPAFAGTMYFGRGTIATAPSNGLTANFKRGSKFTATQQGRIIDLWAYLDGNGGSAGAQDVGMALYEDDNGVPGKQVAQTQYITIAAGTPARWFSFPVNIAR